MNDGNSYTFRGILIWSLCAAFFAYEFLLRTVLGTFQLAIMRDLNLTPVSFATLSATCYMLVYGLMQIPASIIVSKYGLKRTLLFAVGLCIISTIAFAHSNNFYFAVLSRMAMGLGSSFGFVCLLVSVYEWMPKKNYGLYIGLSQFIGTFGPMLAAGPLNKIAINSNVDWRWIFSILGFVGFPLLILICAFVKNNIYKVKKFRIISRKISVIKNVQLILSQKQTWIIASYSALVYFVIEYLSENEGKAFIEMNGFSSSFSSYMITLGWAGYACGCPLWGLLSDIFKRRKQVMVLAAFCCLASLVAIIYYPVSQMMLACSFFLLGMGAGGQSIGFAIMAEQCNDKNIAIGLGFNNAMIAFLSSTIAPVIGGVLALNGSHATLLVQDYQFAFSLIVGLVVLACILSILGINETYCRQRQGFTFIRKSTRMLNSMATS